LGIVQTVPCEPCRYSIASRRVGHFRLFLFPGNTEAVVSGFTRGESPACSCVAGTTAFVKRTRSQPRLRGCSRGLGYAPNKQNLRFPASPGTAGSSLCGNKGTACKVVKLLPNNLFPFSLRLTISPMRLTSILFIHSGGVLRFCIHGTTTVQ